MLFNFYYYVYVCRNKYKALAFEKQYKNVYDCFIYDVWDFQLQILTYKKIKKKIKQLRGTVNWEYNDWHIIAYLYMIIHNIIYIYNFNGFQQIKKKKVMRISVNLLM